MGVSLAAFIGILTKPGRALDTTTVPCHHAAVLVTAKEACTRSTGLISSKGPIAHILTSWCTSVPPGSDISIDTGVSDVPKTTSNGLAASRRRSRLMRRCIVVESLSEELRVEAVCV